MAENGWYRQEVMCCVDTELMGNSSFNVRAIGAVIVTYPDQIIIDGFEAAVPTTSTSSSSKSNADFWEDHPQADSYLDELAVQCVGYWKGMQISKLGWEYCLITTFRKWLHDAWRKFPRMLLMSDSRSVDVGPLNFLCVKYHLGELWTSSSKGYRHHYGVRDLIRLAITPFDYGYMDFERTGLYKTVDEIWRTYFGQRAQPPLLSDFQRHRTTKKWKQPRYSIQHTPQYDALISMTRLFQLRDLITCIF